MQGTNIKCRNSIVLTTIRSKVRKVTRAKIVAIEALQACSLLHLPSKISSAGKRTLISNMIKPHKIRIILDLIHQNHSQIR
jgi:hypothetical protein